MEQVKTIELFSFPLYVSLLVPVIILFVIYYRLSRRRMYELASKIPGPEGYPVIGNALEFIGTPNGIIFLHF